MTIHVDGPVTVYQGDVREVLSQLPSESVQTVVTSPPYWGLRDYGTAIWEGGDAGCDHLGPPMRTNAKTTVPTLERGPTTFHGGTTRAAEPYRALCGKCGAVRIDAQLGLEATPDEYVCAMVEVFREVRRVLRKDGTLWLNLGDSYSGGAGSPEKRAKDASGVLRPNVVHRCERCDKEFSGTGKRRFCSAYCGGIDNSKRHERPPYFLKPKDLVGIPWRVAFALQADGWYLRSDIIWSKPNPMPESVTDRPTKAHEYLFLMTRSPRYYYDADAIRTAFSPETKALSFETMDFARRDGYKAGERAPLGSTVKNGSKPPQDGHRRLVEAVKMARAAGGNHDQPFDLAGANARTVWTIATQAYPDAHFATFPEDLVVPCIKAGSREGDVVLDPFAGSGTTLAVARRLSRKAIGIELQAAYLPLIEKRVSEAALPLLEAI